MQELFHAKLSDGLKTVGARTTPSTAGPDREPGVLGGSPPARRPGTGLKDMCRT
ncbi:hypothetical protein GCM10012282_25810 [Streptomyces lacrimifluminis]|uniref:Uncharacterized protein n=1 Tax=Streptomyces lacrimifluminis TaxID=1500077 RepID=A0A917KUY9_9ACTN|nr:hypothetical protein GCM10012282_25810 [Streptomyces lacrimifluminis]